MAIQFCGLAPVNLRSSAPLLILVCAGLKVNLQSASAVSAENGNSGEFGSYLEVYPPANLSQNQLECIPQPASRTCPLYIALTVSFGHEYLSSGVVPSVQFALDQINADPDLLPGYSLHYTLTDSQCNRTVSLRALHAQIFNPPTKIAAIGSGCSIATEASAEISHFYNITQLSCVSSSAALANRVKYPDYFQLLAPDAGLANGFLAIVKQFGWKRVALIIQEENLLTVTMDRLKQALDSHDIEYSEKRFETGKGIQSLGENPFDPQARIFIVAMYHFRALHLMCKAYEFGMRYPQHVFLFYGWYANNWWLGTEQEQCLLRTMYPDCTPEQRASVVPYSLAPLQAEFLEDQNKSAIISSGINGMQFLAEYDRYLKMSRFNLTHDVYSQQCYDATWALAYALNDTLTECQRRGEGVEDCSLGAATSDTFGLQQFQYNNSRVPQKVKGHLEETDFNGITGRVTFDRSNGVRQVNRIVVLSYQPCHQESENCINITRIGTVTVSDNDTVKFNFNDGYNGENIWGSAGEPYDGVPISHEVTVKLPLAVFYIVLGVLGITFAVICLCFNFAFQKNPLIRLTSPNLNYMIGIGAIILYVYISLSVVPSTDHRVVTVLCNLAPWFNAIGYSLCFGTIVVKMFRVYYIFNNPTPTKKSAIHDWKLALIVLLLVGIDVLILSIFLVVEGVKGRLGAIIVQDREHPMSTEGELQIINLFDVVVCKSKSRDIALGVLYGYKALLQIIAILFAFSIRKVKVKGLDDAKYIVAAVYVTSIVTAVIIVATYTLYDFSNALSVVLCSGIFIGATIILLLVFVPKMIGRYKDPEGTTVFSKQQPASFSHSPQPHAKSNISLAVQKTLQLTDHSTIGEVESLKKRICELESRLAGVNHENINME